MRWSGCRCVSEWMKHNNIIYLNINWRFRQETWFYYHLLIFFLSLGGSRCFKHSHFAPLSACQSDLGTANQVHGVYPRHNRGTYFVHFFSFSFWFLCAFSVSFWLRSLRHNFCRRLLKWWACHFYLFSRHSCDDDAEKRIPFRSCRLQTSDRKKSLWHNWKWSRRSWQFGDSFQFLSSLPLHASPIPFSLL